jgi:predicted metal-dependent HD superfamily phosphohydrolase
MSETRVTFERWESLFRELRCGRGERREFDRLVKAWREPHRHYHSLEHLEACLAELDAVRDLAQRPAEVELALWFHDAVYSPRAEDNEAKSAAWARTVLRAAVVPESVGQRIENHILATREHSAELAGDAALVVDVDLAVLGRAPDAYARYTQAVRAEFRWVPGFLYRRGRRQVLERLVQRPHVYATAEFRKRYETAARANLEQELATLAGRRSAA